MVEETIEKEFECSICWDLMFQPVTISCGHTFCKECLYAHLEKQRQCVMCRVPVLEDQSLDSLTVNVVIQNFIRRQYPEQYRKMQQEFDQKAIKIQQEQAQKDLFQDLPVLICSKLIYRNMQVELELNNDQIKVIQKVSARAYRRDSNNPLQNKSAFFIILKHAQAMQGFLVSYRGIIQTEPTYVVAVTGVNRARVISQITNQQEQLMYASGCTLRDVSQDDQTKDQQLTTRTAEMMQIFNSKINERVLNEGISRNENPEILLREIQSIFQLPEAPLSSEMSSLYMLSQLELQNLRPEVVFQRSTEQRVQIILDALSHTSQNDRLFSWESDPRARKKAAWKQFSMLVLLGFVLLIASYFKQQL